MKRVLVYLLLLVGACASSVAAQEQVVADQVVLGSAACLLRTGSGTPEGAVVGKVCDLYMRSDTGDVYRKTSGSGNTGWSIGYRAGGTDVPVTDGGTGAGTFTSNGVLYGNATGALQVTAGGGANSVLTANGGAPSFSSTPTVTSLTATGSVTGATSVITPILTNGSNLTLSPTGDVIFDPTGNDLLPTTNYDLNLGALSQKYLTLHAAELWVETLVAQNTIATIGGRVLVGPTTTLTADVAATAGDPGLTDGMITYSGVTGGAAGCGVDLVLEQDCFHTDTAVTGATITVDFGASNNKLITKARVYARGTSAAVWRLEKFTGGSWVTVCTFSSLVAGWNQCYTTGAQTAGRDWRLYLTNTPGAGAYSGEIELWEEILVSSKYNNLTSGASGDVVYAESNGKVEFFHVNEGPSGAGPYSYYLTRNLDQTGPNDWYAGDALFNTGHTGSGFMDLYSVRGIKSSSEAGPTIVGNVRSSLAYNDWAPRWAIGNLNGLYDYSADTYGAAFGDPSAAWLKIDATNGFRIGHNATTMASIDASGNATFKGSIQVGPSPLGQYSVLSAIDSFGSAPFNDAAVDFDHSIRVTNTAAATSFRQGLDANDFSGAAGFYVDPYGLGTGYKVFTVRRYPDVGTNPQIVLMPAGTGEYGRGVAVNGPLTVGGIARTNANATLDVTGTAAVSGTLAWGGGSAISSSSNVALVNAVNTFTAFGTHTVSAGGTGLNSFRVRNTTAGTGNGASIVVGNDSSALIGVLQAFSSTFTTSGSQVANGVELQINGAGGLSISANDAAGDVRFYTGGVAERQRMDANGDWRPATDNTRSVGLATHRYSLIRGTTVTAGDFGFENGFAFTESYKVGIAEPGIALVNPDGEVVAFFGAESMKAKGLAGTADVDTLAHVLTTAEDRAQMDAHPEQRISGYEVVTIPDCTPTPKTDTEPARTCTTPGAPIYRTTAEKPMPDPATGTTTTQRKAARAVVKIGGQQ